MIPMIPRRQGFGSRLGEALGGGFQQGFGQGMQQNLARQQYEQQMQMRQMEEERKQQMQQQEQEKEQSILSQILSQPNANPQSQLQALLSAPISDNAKKMAIQHVQEKQKSVGEFDADAENYNKIKENFGDTFADIWKSSPQGARTELTKYALDARMRGLDIDKSLRGLKESKEEEKAASDFPKPNLPKDMTPKELIDFKKQLRKENSPHFGEAHEKERSLMKEGDSIETLKELNESKKLPEGLSRLVINPETGEPYKLAQLTGKINPETQRFIKTINDFTIKAKDSFGARVTNFDLQSFMSRLPGLLNTYEGRKQILKQMESINKLDLAYAESLKEVFQHHGIGNITYEDAVNQAENRIKPIVEKLRSDLRNISGSEAQKGDTREQNLRPIDRATAEMILEEAGGDINKAMEIATQKGFKF